MKGILINRNEDDQRVEIIYGDANDTIDSILDEYRGNIDLVIIDTTEDNANNAGLIVQDSSKSASSFSTMPVSLSRMAFSSKYARTI